MGVSRLPRGGRGRASGVSARVRRRAAQQGELSRRRGNGRGVRADPRHRAVLPSVRIPDGGRQDRRLFHRREVRRYDRRARGEGASRVRRRVSDDRSAVCARLCGRRRAVSQPHGRRGRHGAAQIQTAISAVRDRRQIQRHAPPRDRRRFASARAENGAAHAETRSRRGRRALRPSRGRYGAQSLVGVRLAGGRAEGGGRLARARNGVVPRVRAQIL